MDVPILWGRWQPMTIWLTFISCVPTTMNEILPVLARNLETMFGMQCLVSPLRPPCHQATFVLIGRGGLKAAGMYLHS